MAQVKLQANNEKLQFFAVFLQLQPHCGMGYRCPIKMKLYQSHFLANWQLLWASAPQKFELWFLHLMSIIHFSTKLVKIAYL